MSGRLTLFPPANPLQVADGLPSLVSSLLSNSALMGRSISSVHTSVIQTQWFRTSFSKEFAFFRCLTFTGELDQPASSTFKTWLATVPFWDPHKSDSCHFLLNFRHVMVFICYCFCLLPPPTLYLLSHTTIQKHYSSGVLFETIHDEYSVQEIWSFVSCKQLGTYSYILVLHLGQLLKGGVTRVLTNPQDVEREFYFLQKQETSGRMSVRVSFIIRHNEIAAAQSTICSI